LARIRFYLVILGASTSRAARGLLDWTQLQLADAAQVGIGMLRNFEAGRCLPGEANLFAIQRALEAAGVEFLPDGGVRLRPDQVTFDEGYVVDRYKVRLTAHRNEREVIVDVPRETIDDAAQARAVSTAQRVANFQEYRPEFEACARDVLRSQTPDVRRVNLDTMTFGEWRKRYRRLVDSRAARDF
jgi:transcriptional regulator with XRE-family HTH domain